jgi:hypothetical protein
MWLHQEYKAQMVMWTVKPVKESDGRDFGEQGLRFDKYAFHKSMIPSY